MQIQQNDNTIELFKLTYVPAEFNDDGSTKTGTGQSATVSIGSFAADKSVPAGVKKKLTSGELSYLENFLASKKAETYLRDIDQSRLALRNLAKSLSALRDAGLMGTMPESMKTELETLVASVKSELSSKRRSKPKAAAKKAPAKKAEAESAEA